MQSSICCQAYYRQDHQLLYEECEVKSLLMRQGSFNQVYHSRFTPKVKTKRRFDAKTEIKK
jgi:hypothetical protein